MTESPSCPNCKNYSLRAYCVPAYECRNCGKSIRSNLRKVSFIEWLVGGPLLFLAAAGLEKSPMFNGWSFGAIAFLFFLPICVIHYLVLRKFLKLQIGEVTKDRSPS
jgi:hypothetical protein